MNSMPFTKECLFQQEESLTRSSSQYTPTPMRNEFSIIYCSAWGIYHKRSSLVFEVRNRQFSLLRLAYQHWVQWADRLGTQANCSLLHMHAGTFIGIRVIRWIQQRSKNCPGRLVGIHYECHVTLLAIRIIYKTVIHAGGVLAWSFCEIIYHYLKLGHGHTQLQHWILKRQNG